MTSAELRRRRDRKRAAIIAAYRMSDRQEAMLRAVANGRVARVATGALSAWEVDGKVAHHGQATTLEDLAVRRLIGTTDVGAVTVTTAGELLLAAHDRVGVTGEPHPGAVRPGAGSARG